MYDFMILVAQWAGWYEFHNKGVPSFMDLDNPGIVFEVVH